MKPTQGQPLIKVAPYIFRLQYDEPGIETVKKVLLDYKGTVAVLNTFGPEVIEGPVKGSNYYSRMALGKVYRELTNADVMPINPIESEIALANNTLTDTNNSYEDLGLIVYPIKGDNEILWKYLREQTKSNFQDIDERKPFVVTGLMDPVKDDKYENGLKFDFNELTKVYNVLILSKKTGNFNSKDKGLQEIGFPYKLGEGDRTLCTANNRVRRLYRDRDLNLDAGNVLLASSNVAGRVHFVENFSSENLDELISKINTERLKQEKDLKERFDKAMNILKNQ